MKDNVSTSVQDNMEIAGLERAETEVYEAGPKNNMQSEDDGQDTMQPSPKTSCSRNYWPG